MSTEDWNTRDWRLGLYQPLVATGVTEGGVIHFIRGMERPDNIPHSELIQSSSPAAFETGFAKLTLRVTMRHDVNLRAYTECAIERFEGPDYLVLQERGINVGPGRQWTSRRFQQRIMIVKLDPKLIPVTGCPSSPSFQAAMTELIDAVRYDRDTTNQSYYGGDVHSWQRYTLELPLSARLQLTTANTFEFELGQPLHPGSWYAVALLHTENHLREREDQPQFRADAMAHVFGRTQYRCNQGTVISDCLVPFKARAAWQIVRLLWLGTRDEGCLLHWLAGSPGLLRMIVAHLDR
uniref:Uncharacterized protein n=1 Tax=Prymnesium polylepis TaxID=72548 RepID=A0A7S4J4P8_9EUKA